MATVRVFYAWSSDNDHRVCRGFIFEALNKACKQITAELEEAGRPVELDHDTKGATGSPAITETIEKKIKECDVFVADLTPTYVQNREDGPARIVPNPNVMYELGYAYRSVGSDRIIAVLNTAFAAGARKDERLIVDGALPFNLWHRSFPDCYELYEGANKPTLRKEREQLAKQLFNNIKPIAELATIVVGPKYEPHRPIEGRVATFLKNGEVLLNHRSKIAWRDELQQIYVRYIPKADVRLTNLALEGAFKLERSGIPPHSTDTGNYGLNKYGFVTCGVKALPDDVIIARDMLQFFKSGEVWGVFGKFLKNDPDHHVSWLAEDLFTWAAAQIAYFADAADLRGPGRFVFGITGIEGRHFVYPTDGYQSPAPFHQDTFKYEQDVDSCQTTIIRMVAEAAAEHLWAEAGVERPKQLSTPEWRQNNNYRPGYWHLFEMERE